MSKAFTKESDDAPEEPLAPRSIFSPGEKRYLTKDGAERFRAEMQKLVENRGELDRHSEDVDARRKLRALDQRLLELEELLTSAEIVAPASCAPDEVCFGATVRVREADGTEYDYRIVGVEEVDLERGWVSYLSPIARALMGARTGERIPFKFPSGEKQLEILAVTA